MTMTHKLRDGLDGWLWRRGYDHPEVRELVRWQVLLAALITVVCLPLSLLWPGAWSLLAGTGIISANFCSLARFGQRVVGKRNTRTAIAGMVFGFYLRLILTGAALYACIVWLEARPMPLLIGISTVVVNIIIWGVARYAQTRARQTLTGKEA